MEELTKGIDRVKTSLSKYRTNKSNKFSLVHKASCLTINEHQDVAKRGEGSGGYPIVLIEERISEFNDNVSVKIVEQPGNKGIWIGVCVLDIVKTFNYQSCYGIGKGTWAIDQVGQTHVSAYTWSHHDSAYNSQPKVVLQRLLQGFQFAVGDTINIRVDFQKKVVIFTKGDAVYEQPIKTDIGDIYAFVGPTHINDSISLVS